MSVVDLVTGSYERAQGRATLASILAPVFADVAMPREDVEAWRDAILDRCNRGDYDFSTLDMLAFLNGWLEPDAS